MRALSNVSTRKATYRLDAPHEIYLPYRAMSLAVGSTTTTPEIQESIFGLPPTKTLRPARLLEVLSVEKNWLALRTTNPEAQQEDFGVYIDLPPAAMHVAMAALQWMTPGADTPASWYMNDDYRHDAGLIYAEYNELVASQS